MARQAKIRAAKIEYWRNRGTGTSKGEIVDPEPSGEAGRPPRKRGRPRKSTGELELFKKIWDSRPHVCSWCGMVLGGDFDVRYMSHIRPKSTYPELRLVPENIAIECATCHTLRDHGAREKLDERKNLYRT